MSTIMYLRTHYTGAGKGPTQGRVTHFIVPKTYSALGFTFYRITEPPLSLGFYYMFNKGVWYLN